MKSLVASVMLATLVAAAMAETSLIDTVVLPSKQVYGVAEITPLVLSSSGKPVVILLDLDAGDGVPPRATKGNLRLLTVISGAMSWGDGDEIDETQETVYPTGSVLTLPAGLDDESPVSGILEQMR